MQAVRPVREDLHRRVRRGGYQALPRPQDPQENQHPGESARPPAPAALDALFHASPLHPGCGVRKKKCL